MASDKVAMPMSSAGIVGFSPDIKIAGREVDPKLIIGVVIVLVLIVHVARYVTLT